MNTLISITKRNIKMYTRDKINILLSFTSVLILIMLYLLFLGKTLEKSFISIFEDLGITYDKTDIKIVVNSLMIAGILFMNALNLPITILGRMAIDKNSKVLRDFYVTPVSKTKIMFGYILSAIVITFVFNVITMVLGQVYILILGGSIWSISTILITLVLSTLAIVIFSSLIMLLLTFIKNETQLSLLSTTLGVLSGFVSGLYIPFSALSKSFSNILSVLPFAGISSLIKKYLLENTIDTMLKDVTITEQKEALIKSINETAGIDLYYGNDLISSGTIYMIITGFTVVILALAAFRLTRTKEN